MIKGLYQTNMQVCTVTELLSEAIDVGDRVLIWGGNQAGLVLADHLAARGKRVTVLHRREHFAEEMSGNDRYYLRERLKLSGVTLYKNVHVQSFLVDGVRFRAGDRAMELREFESLVLADTFVSLREAANLVRPSGARVHFIGDAKTPRHLMYAVSEGEELGRAL
jgi:pyruvate/2-oxoglutarate dehydrogenase complex dihydrolipoamide dehydrogenase (E3) component